MPIMTTIQRIKPGRWFENGRGRRMMKVMDIRPSGLHCGLAQILLGRPEGFWANAEAELSGDFVVNADDDNGTP